MRQSCAGPGDIGKWRDSTTHVVLDPLDFIAQLAALVPPPRRHLTRYHGVLAPHISPRALITQACLAMWRCAGRSVRDREATLRWSCWRGAGRVALDACVLEAAAAGALESTIRPLLDQR